MEDKNVFSEIETDKKPSTDTKKAVISELEIIQNASKVLDLFVSKYFKTLIQSFGNKKN